MSQANLQKQLSEIQSKLDSKRAKTPTKEKANSSKRREKKSKSPSRKHAQTHKMLMKASDDKRRAQFKGGWNANWNIFNPPDFVKGNFPPLSHHIVTLKSLHALTTVHKKKQDLDVKLGSRVKIWDPSARVEVDGVSRFQKYAEFKASLLKSSGIARDLKENYIKCEHRWVIRKGNTADTFVTMCEKCNMFQRDFKDEKEADTDDLLQQMYDTVCQELETARETFRAGLKNKPMMIRLVHSFYINTTVTSGITNGVALTTGAGNQSLPITPYNTSDWSGISILFDEYKVHGGDAIFNYHNPTAGTNGGTNMDPNGLPVIAYDPTDAPPPTSARDASVIAQHKYLNNLISDTSPSGPVVPACGGRHEFHWRPPPGAYVDPITDATADVWTPVAYANTINVGYLKFYHVGKQTAALATGAGHVHMNVAMRCRT